MDKTNPVLKQLTTCDVWIWDHHAFKQSNVQYIHDSNMFSADNYIAQVLDVEYTITEDKLFIEMEKYKIYCPANTLFVIRFNYGKSHDPVVFWMPISAQKLGYEIVDNQLVTDLDFHEHKMNPIKNYIGTATNFAIFVTYKKIPLSKDRRTDKEMICYMAKNAMVRFNTL